MHTEPNVLCPLADCPVGEISSVDAQINGQLESLILWRGEDAVRVFLNACPHAGRRLDYAPGKFLLQNDRLICAAHGAAFAVRDGHCVSGPCRGQSLQSLNVRVIDGMICLPASD
ncbi:MAG: Rieske 2Fe-2S domain-containing protein [Xanthomonadales bacterium]|jgi:nitrite reductase/ring-hydroxylating ferredoxin subunit|nr:Rieske 2Fe-2S domain-containing protein [Xanthomonadales bacterium]HRD72170.1 Rieske 2Fe-2S domain-containing protein [Aquimonas sp.]